MSPDVRTLLRMRTLPSERVRSRSRCFHRLEQARISRRTAICALGNTPIVTRGGSKPLSPDVRDVVEPECLSFCENLWRERSADYVAE